METVGNSGSKNISAYDFIKIIWIKRLILIKWILIINILSITILLLLPNKYRSSATILPDDNSSGKYSGIADLASIAGITLNSNTSMVRLFPDIIYSEVVLKNVILKKYQSIEFKDSVNLMEYYDLHFDDTLKLYDETLIKFKKAIDIEVDKKTGIITISMVSEESDLAAAIINQIIVELNSFLKTKQTSSAKERRIWIEKRIYEVGRDLRSSEDSVTDFKSRNRLINNSPQLILEQQRLVRNVEINNTVFLELKRQIELAKIDEVNTMPIVNILDHARKTTIKVSPIRSILSIIIFTLSIGLITGYLVVTSLFKEQIIAIVTRLRSITTNS